VARRRPTIPAAVETAVLTKSARRCCLCFGLGGDLQEKAGQIAHLDGDRTNNKEDNLAWLCLVHHNDYDSTTSQAKNYTLREVKQYRDRLYTRVRQGVAPHPEAGSTGRGYKSARDVVSVCRRMALMTETDYENNADAMFSSINACRAALQQMTDYVEPASVRPLVDRIVLRLHDIEAKRAGYKKGGDEGRQAGRAIDRIKLEVLATLLELQQLSGEDFRIPRRLIRGHYYYDAKGAEEPPTEIFY
jgi:hypothetical protein